MCGSRCVSAAPLSSSRLMRKTSGCPAGSPGRRTGRLPSAPLYRSRPAEWHTRRVPLRAGGPGPRRARRARSCGRGRAPGARGQVALAACATWPLRVRCRVWRPPPRRRSRRCAPMRRIRVRAAAPRGRRWRSARRSASTAYLPLFEDGGRTRDDVRRFGARVLERTARWHAPLADELEALRARGAARARARRGAQRAHRAAGAAGVHDRRPAARVPTGPWLAQNWDWYADAPERCVVWSAAVRGRALRDDDGGRDPRQGRRLDARHRRGAQHPLPPRGRARRARRARAPRAAAAARRGRERRGGLGAPARDAVLGVELHHRRSTPAAAGACFELSPAGVARIEPRDGLLAHANHFLDDGLWPTPRASSRHEWLAGSRARLAAAGRAAPRRARRRARAARHA